MERRRLADVILTGPTGMAVAIRYDPDTMPAPTVIAKGAGLIGQRIRDSAGQYKIATLEEPSLAQAVYRSVAINRPIPAENYTAVAEVLTKVYQRDACIHHNLAEQGRLPYAVESSMAAVGRAILPPPLYLHRVEVSRTMMSNL